MDLTREERMRSRMRGAARHQVQNADFGDLFTIPSIAPAPAPDSSEPTGPSSEPSTAVPVPSPAQRTNPNISVKRRRLDWEGSAGPSPQAHPSTQPPPAQSSSASRRSQRLSRSPTNRDPYDLENAPVLANEDEAAPKSTPPSRTATKRDPGSRSAAPRSAAQNSPTHTSPLTEVQLSEEVGESPADQPGSGQRQRVRASNAVTSSALLQSALRADDNYGDERLLQYSSPLSRKSRKSVAETAAPRTSTLTGLRRSARLSSNSDEEVNELSSDMLAPVEEVSAVNAAEAEKPAGYELLEIEESITIQAGPDEAAEAEAAEDIDAREAARPLGRKRQRRTLPEVSPDVSPESASEEVTEGPSAKHPRKRPPPKLNKGGPADQKQPKAVVKRVKPSKPAPARARRAKTGGAGGPPVPVKIQRFTKPKHFDEDDADADDILHTELPYANRCGVNAVDVLAQMCEEIIDASIQSLKEAFSDAQDAAMRKELLTKKRALEAFREELRTRLLEHTIALDTLFALKRRVREAQKEKLKLRERIIQIRAEREQVALRMDAIRIKHDADSKEALHNISASSAMHDIDLAIEQGRAAPELSPKDEKTADLANLELLISRITEQACSAGPSGGVLKQITSFNAFLERVAAAI